MAIDTVAVLERIVEIQPENQKIKAIEELAELQKEICKSLCGKTDKDHIAEEIADCLIMIDQLKIIYDVSHDVETWRSNKMLRLVDRMINLGWIEP